MEKLEKYKKNITSQWGEDGIIEEIFKKIGTKEKFCIEFGAWDGKHLSNVWNLWHENNWSAFLIEGDEKKCKDLEISVSLFPKVKPYCAYVQKEGENSLDKILNKTFPNKEIDLLSIDIDGNDYYILETLKAKPRVIIIEYNPTIPVHLELVQKENQYFGSSALSIYKLATHKGYKLVCITETNMFFVIENEFSKFQMEEQKLEDIFIAKHLTYLMTGYDGTPVLTQIPTYNNILKTTKREIYFKKEKLPTINFSIHKSKYSYIKNIIIFLEKALSKINFFLKKNKEEDLQTKRVVPWFKIEGDKTLRLNYNLEPSSIVIDVGGFEGQWSSDIFSKYQCNIHIFEPVKSFFDKIKERFNKNNKIKIYNLGLSNKNTELPISLLNDSSSLFKINTQYEHIKVVDASIFLKEQNIEKVDLIKINIEGGEYDLLENLIETGYISKIKNIQVQFHDFVPNAKERMLKIQKELEKTHHTTYQYEFVWENWEINEK